jgi:hypothetical protein
VIEEAIVRVKAAAPGYGGLHLLTRHHLVRFPA